MEVFACFIGTKPISVQSLPYAKHINKQKILFTLLYQQRLPDEVAFVFYFKSALRRFFIFAPSIRSSIRSGFRS